MFAFFHFTVTYRVVQVNDLQSNEQNQSHVVSTPIGGTQGVTQAIIAHGSPFVTSNTSPASSSDSPFYVMMAPAQEIVTSHGTLTRKRSSSSDCNKNSRDEKRRATHNEVERRRRDKINNWIMKLSKIVPDCAQDHTKQGQVCQGHLGILSTSINFAFLLTPTYLTVQRRHTSQSL